MKTEFTSPSKAIVDELELELRSHGYGFDELLASGLVAEGEKLWFVKWFPPHISDRNRAIKLEVLVQSLGNGLVNVATVKRLSQDDIANIRMLPSVQLPDDISSQNAMLVRLGQRYSTSELPLKDLDSAVAGELVFSVWVRRRDPHSFNRAYNSDNIPVFFDLHAALNGLEGEDWRDIAKFFPDDGGVASVWRVKETKIPPTTEMYRRYRPHNDTHDIYNIGKFQQAALRIAEQIISDNRNLRTLVETADFTGTEIDYLVKYLEETKRTLREDVNKMLKVVLS